MRKANLSIPEIGAIAATRGMAAAGAALLMSDRISDKKKRPLGIALLAIGALSTIPLALDFFHKLKKPCPQEQ